MSLLSLAMVLFQLLDARVVYKTADASGAVDCVRLFGRSEEGEAVSVDVTDPEWCFWVPCKSVPDSALRSVNDQLPCNVSGVRPIVARPRVPPCA